MSVSSCWSTGIRRFAKRSGGPIRPGIRGLAPGATDAAVPLPLISRLTPRIKLRHPLLYSLLTAERSSSPEALTRRASGQSKGRAV